MKIVITASGQSPDAQVDPRFGRAAGFVLYDTESGEYQAHDNSQNLNAMQGAGIQAAQTVADLGAEALITGHCGPKAFRALQAADIAVYNGAEGTVREAVEQFKKGALSQAAGADVEGHWA